METRIVPLLSFAAAAKQQKLAERASLRGSRETLFSFLFIYFIYFIYNNIIE
jgi:hypothetical protein